MTNQDASPDPKESVVACVPVGLPEPDDKYHTYGYAKDKCPKCGEEIYVGPRSQEMILAGAEYFCMYCIALEENLSLGEAKSLGGL